MANKKDLNDIINTLIAEGIGEGKEGMRRIAETIINRSEQRGLTPAQVVRQRAQYTGYAKPGAGAKRAQNTKEARTAAEAAWQLAQGPEDPTGGANFYFNPDLAKPAWAKDMTPTGTYQNHAFYTDRSPASIIPQVTPQTQSDDMRLMRNPAMSPVARRSATDSFVNNSASSAPSVLQDALNRRAAIDRAPPLPASEEDRVNARMNALMRSDPLPPVSNASVQGGGLSRTLSAGAGITALNPDRPLPSINLLDDPGYMPSIEQMQAGIPSAQEKRDARNKLVQSVSSSATGYRDVGVGLPQRTGDVNSFNEFYRGIVPSSAMAPDPASADERLMARMSPQPIPIIPSSQIERGGARVAAPIIGTSQIERGPSYALPTPVATARMPVKQTADRLTPSALVETVPTSTNVTAYTNTARNNDYPFGMPPQEPIAPSPALAAVQQAAIPTAVPLPRARPFYAPSSLNAIAGIAPAAPIPTMPMGGGADQNLGPVNNWLGQANPVPNSINIATGSPAPIGRIQRKGFLPGVDLPGLPGMLQDLSTAAANSSGTLSNGFDNLLQRTMRGPTSTAPVQFVGTNGYNYGRDNTGRIVNLGSSQPNLSPAQLYESKLTRSKPTTEDKVTGRASSGSFYGL